MAVARGIAGPLGVKWCRAATTHPPLKKGEWVALKEKPGELEPALLPSRRTSADTRSLWPLKALGRRSEADTALAVAEAKFPKVVEYPIAVVYANRNDPDRAFEWLNRAVQLRDGWVPWTRWDPLLKNIRSDSRYKSLLRKLNLPEK